MTATVDEREQLAEMLIPIAGQLAFNVHTRDVGGVKRVLEIVAPEHLRALAVVLAGMVDDRRTPAEMLAWLGEDGEAAATIQTPATAAETGAGRRAVAGPIRREEADR